MRLAALLLAIEAHRTVDPSEAARLALQVVAFGRDLARHPTILGAMIGVVASLPGYRSIGSALERGLPREDLVWLLSALDRLGPLDVTSNFAGDRFSSEVEIALILGRTVGSDAWRGDRVVKTPHVLATIYFAWDWSRYVGFAERQERILRLPYLERLTASAALNEELDHSWALMTVLTSTNLVTAMVHVESVNAIHDLVRILVAAHVHRLDHGELPRALADLTPYLGVEPRDPFRSDGGPLSLTGGPDELRAHSWYENGVDDAGAGAPWEPKKSPDLVVVTRAPK